MDKDTYDTLLVFQEVEGDKFNFLQAAREEQEKEEVEEEEEMEVVEKEGRRKKPKVNVYDFFQQMMDVCVRPLDSSQ